MIETTLVQEQLKRIKFNTQAWNRAETQELAEIILPNEQIFECVNGWYEGGFALVCATNIRVLLIDKKPFNYLTVEDLRFDMINEIDYSHRLLEARINISTGAKTLTFRSFNQPRLRKLITHVQHRMAEIKNEQTKQNDRQQEHLKQIDQRLQTYLIAQYQQHESMRRQLVDPTDIDQLATVQTFEPVEVKAVKKKLVWDGTAYNKDKLPVVNGVSAAELYEEGRNEVFKTSKTASSSPKGSFSRLPPIFRHRHVGRTLLRGLLIHPVAQPAA